MTVPPPAPPADRRGSAHALFKTHTLFKSIFLPRDGLPATAPTPSAFRANCACRVNGARPIGPCGGDAVHHLGQTSRLVFKARWVELLVPSSARRAPAPSRPPLFLARPGCPIYGNAGGQGRRSLGCEAAAHGLRCSCSPFTTDRAFLEYQYGFSCLSVSPLVLGSVCNSRLFFPRGSAPTV